MSTNVGIRLPEELLEKVDKAAGGRKGRSKYIRDLLCTSMQVERRPRWIRQNEETRLRIAAEMDRLRDFLTHGSDEEPVLIRLARLRLEGASYRTIVNTLNEEKMGTPNRDTIWTTPLVGYWLKKIAGEQAE